MERYVVFEDEFSIAFLDRKPVFIGHTLLIPKIHTETISDLPRKLVGPLFTNMQLVSRAVQSALSSDDIFVAINNNVSQSVPHLHIHVVPRKFGDGLKGFFWPRTKYSSEDQMNDTKSAIMEAVRSLRAS
ncbi:MAG: HIT family protein [Nitrososphaerota archaeon]|nr:HIT family protein [Nitrososphaerota archaeon]